MLQREDNDKLLYYKRKLAMELKKVVKVGDFTLSSGQKSNFYINCRDFLLTYDGMYFISNAVTSFKLPYFFSVAGVTSGADSITCSVALSLQCNALFIRKDLKDHGIAKKVDGVIPTGASQTLIVDDVLTTGKSLYLAYDSLKEVGLDPVAAVVVVDRKENDAMNEVRNKLNIPVFSVLTKTDLIGNQS